jgi:peptidoglycan/LPS O-acetylase OafA/YrhL
MPNTITASLPDKTITGKPHYEVLDGLRGSAAILVVLYHIMGMANGWTDDGQLLHHAHLAVDFFFGLSGFVIAFAYDDRWKSLSTGKFIITRLVRLHPLVVLGAILGLLCFLYDPFAENQKAVPIVIVLVDFALTCLLMPYPALPNHGADTHSLVTPAWSLLQEYIGNLAYALVLRRLNLKILGAVIAVAGMVLIAIAVKKNSLNFGPGWHKMWMGTVRMAFSFSLGLCLYRIRDRLPKFQLGWLPSTLILIAIFAVPLVPLNVPHGNGLYEVLVVILIFPLLILSGTHSNTGKPEMVLCKFSGRISYPLYILHFPLLSIYMNFVAFRKPAADVIYMAGTVSFVSVMIFAWLAMKFYDEPIRRELRRLIHNKR